jgi:phospholipase C
LASNLDKIDQIVVLMMENRSFDHMLGYLRLKQVLPVDGLKGTEANIDGTRLVRVHPLTSTRFPTDVGHSFADVSEQLAGGNQGFVANYLKQPVHATPPDPVMGYQDESQVWAYDYLARTFAVCDHWFSSVPGPTIPNRLFSLAGSSGGDKDQPKGIKFYGLKTVFDCLDQRLRDRPKDDRWGYYFHDLPMLALLKQHRDELSPGFLRKVLKFLTGWTPRIRKVDVFFDRARQGRLPAVSWIDPNFADFGGSNDDHPPKGDLYDGQSLVARVFEAILNGGSDLWRKTLLVFLYDEHGGFYDHVSPSASGDPAPFDRFGVRVPAIVVSAWTPPVVDGAERDHTSLLRTILDRFAPAELLTPRVARAASLAGLLSLPSPRTDARPIPIPARPMVALGATAAAAAAPTEMEELVRAYREELGRRGVTLE